VTAALADPFTARFRTADCARSDPTFEVRLGSGRPNHSVYMRRRLIAAMLVVAFCGGVGGIVQSVLADRGGVPASTPAIQPAATRADSVATFSAAGAVIQAAPALTYVVQPGDTLWGIADRLRGQASMSDYVDQLVASNGGAAVQAGQLLSLP